MKKLFWIPFAIFVFGCSTEADPTNSGASGFYWRAPNIAARGQRDAVGTRDEPYMELNIGSGIALGCSVSPAGERTDQHRTDTATVLGDSLIFKKRFFSDNLSIVGADTLKSLPPGSDVWIRQQVLPSVCTN
jgi:hypothetical protein